jgi:hypothetical protein
MHSTEPFARPPNQPNPPTQPTHAPNPSNHPPNQPTHPTPPNPRPPSFHAINETTVEAWVRDSSGADVTAFLDATSVSSGRRPGSPGDAGDGGVVHNLFAFPAEDNFAGGGGMGLYGGGGWGWGLWWLCWEAGVRC